MRLIFCGNFEYETRQSDLERLFSKYGTVERFDKESGFAFVLRMIVMLMMQSKVLTIFHLVMTSASCLWSVPKVNVAVIGRVFKIFSITINLNKI